MASFNKKSTPYVDADDKAYEMGTMVEATVAEKYRGTIKDQHDLKVLVERRNYGFDTSPLLDGESLT